MGFFGNIMRKIASSSMSAIVGTTDTVVNHYLKIKAFSPQKLDNEIYEEIIKFRYSTMPLKEEWRYKDLLEQSKKVTDLKTLIFEIITNESPELLSAGTDNMVMTLEIIQEHLEKYNLK